MAGAKMVWRALTLLTVASVVAVPAAQQTPTVRATVDVIPVDVRVVDRRGQPVTGLTAADFSVRVDGIAQPITVFSEIRGGQAVVERTERQSGSAGLAAQAPLATPVARPRVFLIYLGRGRLQHPAMGLDAALSFVTQRLGPHDQVAITAWNRATPFTSNPTTIVPVLKRFSERHTSIEQSLQQHFSGVRARLDSMAGSPSPIPASIQADIDDVFGPRALAPPPGADSATLLARSREARSMLSAIEESELTSPDSPRLSSLGATTGTGGWSGASLYDFAEVNTRGMQDLIGLYGAIAHLSFVDGEKHLIYITEHGFYNPSADSDRGLAARAAMARVAISVVHTGGTTLGPPPNTFIPTTTAGVPVTTEASVGQLNVNRAPAPWLTPSFLPSASDWRINTSRLLAEQTGGYFTSTSAATTFFERVDRNANTYYQIGIAASPSAPRSQSARITVEVSRRNVDVVYRRRHSPERLSTPTRRDVYAAWRLGEAATSPESLGALSVSATVESSTSSSLLVELVAGPVGVTLGSDAGGAKVELDIALYCLSDKGELLGQHVQAVDLTLSAAEVSTVRTRGLRIRVPVTVTGRVQHVRAVVYDWKTDRLGALTINR